MHLFRPNSLENLEKIPNNTGTIACIGNFDGVHIGHKKLLEKCVHEAKKRNLPSVVISFSPHPSSLFSEKPVANLQSLEDKISFLEKQGIDYCYIIEFTKEFATKTAEEFAQDFLYKHIQCKALIIGHNFHMGSDKCHTKEIEKILKNECTLSIVDEVLLNNKEFSNISVSSTNIRKALLNSEIALAHAMLGRQYSVRGKVVHGAKRGSTMLGFPTANIDHETNLLPRQNVYATNTKYKGKIYKSISNIGYNPTFAGDTLIMETFILDFKQDIYDEEIEVFFIEKLREEKKFDSIDELISQLKKDEAYRRSID